MVRHLLQRSLAWGNGMCGRRSAERQRMLRKNGPKKLRAILKKLDRREEW